MNIKELKEKYPKSYLAHNKGVIYLADEVGVHGELNLDNWLETTNNEDLTPRITWNRR